MSVCNGISAHWKNKFLFNYSEFDLKRIKCYYNYSGDYRNSRAPIGWEWRHIPEMIIAAASRFVDVPQEEINLMKENAIPRNSKHARKFGMTLFKGKMWKLCLNVTKKPFKF